MRDGIVIGERYADGFTAATPQLGWSMSKSVTNLLTGRLVLEGKVSLTDAQLRPEWTDERARITVDDLLRMTGGLQWDETYELGTPITQMLYDEPDMALFMARQPAAHPPGTFQQYSTGSTVLLCSVLNAKAGLGPNLPRRMLFQPLGLGSAVMEIDAAGTPVCGSYLWATPRDWGRIGQFALNDGVVHGERLLPEGWMAESTRVRPVALTDADGMAASWWANERVDGSLVEPILPASAYWRRGMMDSGCSSCPTRAS
nr:serine hydrolase [Tessaracoccus coleopterorum]